MALIDVKSSTATYTITIKPGVLREAGTRIRDAAPHDRALLAVDANVASTHGSIVRESLRNAGFEVHIHELVADESCKTFDTVERMFRAMLKARLERTSPVVALGGGMVGDLAGFAAATYMRGIPLVHIPTTLLAMVDASIGGKTAVNLSGLHGELLKNMIGAFWQPKAVLIDPHALTTLDERDFRCGLAECVKHALIADAGLLRLLADNASAIARQEVAVLLELIERSARIKVKIVEQDEHEDGCRALLNLGHTFAHAIESDVGLGLKHGEAVAIGLAAAARCAVRIGTLTGDQESRIIDLLQLLKLPCRLPQSIGVNRLMSTMSYDKKVRGNRLRLILPCGLGKAEIVEDVPADIVRETWAHIGAA